MAGSTAATIDLRVTAVCNELARGALTSDIYKFAEEQWGVKSRQADTYIQRARCRLRQQVGDVDRPSYMAQHVATLHTILRESLADRNWSCALGATSQLARITGLEKG